MQNKTIIFLLVVVVALTFFYQVKNNQLLNPLLNQAYPSNEDKFDIILPSSTPSPSPTPKPLTFAEMNKLYGPCVYLPVLMYHHVEDPILARDKHQTSISVNTDNFANQMKYLNDRGYKTSSVTDLINFFDSAGIVNKKTILITFDDGYQDFYSNAYPILKQYGFSAVVFLPTGLMNNNDYLNWSEISEMAGNGMFFANHTWSHKSVLQKPDVVENEIKLADTQLNERGLNSPKIFAYPYGGDNSFAQNYLTSLGYKLAFTTKFGSTLCNKKRFDLPRMRVGNNNLSSYGL